MELELYFLKHDCMHTKGHERGPGTSSDLKVMVKIHIVSVGMIEILKKSSDRYNLFSSSFI